jgi:hypothetical protein
MPTLRLLTLLGAFATACSLSLGQTPAPAPTAAPDTAGRLVLPLNADWRFSKTPAAPSAAVADWETVSLPHTWNALDGQDGPAAISDTREDEAAANRIAAERKAANPRQPGTNLRKPYHRGACWYQKTFDVPAAWKGHQTRFPARRCRQHRRPHLR